MTDDGREHVTDGALPDSSTRADEPKTCANCASRINTEEWHPIETRSDDGDFRVYAFCDEDCRDEWMDD